MEGVDIGIAYAKNHHEVLRYDVSHVSAIPVIVAGEINTGTDLEEKMRLISIEKQHAQNGEAVIVNVDNICSIFEDKGAVVVRMACGWGLYTKFTDVSHAADYIQRAADHVLEQQAG